MGSYLYIKPEDKTKDQKMYSKMIIHSLLIDLIQEEIEIKFSEPIE